MKIMAVVTLGAPCALVGFGGALAASAEEKIPITTASQDARQLYVTNRDEGTVSVVNFASRSQVAIWSVPGGSPDMGGVSADGRVLWLAGRYHAEVYALSTADGRLLARIPVGLSPHGLSVWPQPGRYSLGHTGVMR